MSSERCPGCGVTDFPHLDGCPHEAKLAAEAMRAVRAVSTRRQLDQRARQLAEQRATFLEGLGGGVPSTPEQRSLWTQLAEERQAVEDALERLALEERIAHYQAHAQNASAAGLKREAHHYAAEAAYLTERLAEVHHG